MVWPTGNLKYILLELPVCVNPTSHKSPPAKIDESILVFTSLGITEPRWQDRSCYWKVEPLGVLQKDGTDFLHAVLLLGWKYVFLRCGVSVPPLMADSEQLKTGLKIFLCWMRNGNEPLSKQFQQSFLYVIQAKFVLMMFSSFGLL